MKLRNTVKLFLIISIFFVNFVSAMEGDNKAKAAQHNLDGIKCFQEGPALYNRALTHLAQAIKLDPENPQYYFNLGQVHFQMGNYGQALDSFAQAIKFGPDNPEHYKLHGNSYFNLSKFDDAITDYKAEQFRKVFYELLLLLCV